MSVTVTLNLLGVRPFQLMEEVMTFEPGAAPLLDGLIDLVDGRNPGFRAAMVTEGGELNRQFAVLLNGVNAAFSGGLSAALSDGDVINVIPAIAGG
jgi:molybdopterin converting factor small subunit